MINNDDDISTPPQDLVDAGNELHTVLERYLATPDAPDARTDIFYAQEKLALAVTGYTHWESEDGQALHTAVRDLAGSIQYGHGATLTELRAALDQLNAL
ncbi:hypothetical protein [Kitasatospora sp. NBC_01300]|uniref:hypothetical protein n=1 Tax=Kitasatospora sp. NBC_01300 TaxID=2903574 RepID=UPI002F91A48A|nr:hypothetical protein OG556_39995 [Kitasatospora sp. NBC_01300]